MNILLVDSDRITALSCKTALEGAGHTVIWAKSGQGAVNAADENTPSVVITELNLPSHNGVEFLYEFRSQADWHHIPIIIYSEVARSEIKVSSSAWNNLGIKEYFYKTSTAPDKLIEAVNKVSLANA